MSVSEQRGIAAILAVIVGLVGSDLLTDFRQGARGWHLAVEGAIAVAALFGIFLLLRGSLALRRSLTEERRQSAALKAESERWRQQSKRALEGLSQAIDAQLVAWKLTVSEKEVAFLLLKGLSLKEIAEVRKTSEKTARVQSTAIYAKAGLAGRSELAAFFLEDLLVPGNPGSRPAE